MKYPYENSLSGRSSHPFVVCHPVTYHTTVKLIAVVSDMKHVGGDGRLSNCFLLRAKACEGGVHRRSHAPKRILDHFLEGGPGRWRCAAKLVTKRTRNGMVLRYRTQLLQQRVHKKTNITRQHHPPGITTPLVGHIYDRADQAASISAMYSLASFVPATLRIWCCMLVKMVTSV